MRRSTTRLAAAAVAATLLAACGAGDDTTDAGGSASAPPDAEQTQSDGDGTEMGDMGATDGDMGAGDEMDMSGAYGEPAASSEADRTIEVTVDKDLAFKPAEFEVAPGEVVTFRITNTGDVEHEFVLGDEEAQQQMADEMSQDDGHGHSGDMSNAVTIHPGEEAELTWRFPDDATTVLVGCNVPGHYEAGMRGTVTVG
jgi:uncharacterized cupredoxin-like copper-binding protein